MTDRAAEAHVIPEHLRDWVVIVDSSNMKQFLGVLLHRRRVAAARVSQQQLSGPVALLEFDSTGPAPEGDGRGGPAARRRSRRKKANHRW